MKSGTRNFCTVGFLLLALAALSAVPAAAQDRTPSLTGSPENPLKPLDRPVSFTSQEGDFRVTWPEGCGQLRTRTPAEVDQSSNIEYPVIVSCDRGGEEGEGCSVTALFNVKNPEGGPPGPAEVIARMENLLAKFGAEIKRQAPLSKDFGDGLVVEGLDLQAAQDGGAGQLWVRGLLVGSDIYVLAAWDLGGGVWGNPEYLNFFNSFMPGTE